MQACISVCTYVSILLMNANIYLYLYIYIYVSLYECRDFFIFYVCMHAHMLIYFMHVCRYICMYVCVHTRLPEERWVFSSGNVTYTPCTAHPYLLNKCHVYKAIIWGLPLKKYSGYMNIWNNCTFVWKSLFLHLSSCLWQIIHLIIWVS